MGFIRILLFIAFFFLNTSNGNCIDSEDLKKIEELYGNEKNYQPRVIHESVLHFQIYDNIILLPIKLNDDAEEHLFILDTGATSCVIDQKLAKKLDIHKELEFSLTATGDAVKEKVGTMAFSTLKHVQVGNSFIEKIPVGILDCYLFCNRADGIIGNNFLKFFKVVIDYPNKNVILSDPDITSIQSPNIFHFDNKGNHVLVNIPIWIDKTESVIGMIDTGAHRTTLSTALVKKLNYGEQNIIPFKGISGGGAFGLHLPGCRSSYARIKSLKMGGIEIKNLPVMIEDSDYTERAIIGYDFLSHFKISIDYSRNECAMDLSPEPFKNNIFTTGLGILDQYEHKIVICLLKNSPADLSGIQLNDEIIKINGIPTSELRQSDIRALENDNSIETISYTIKESNGNIKEITLKKKMLFPEIY